MATYIIIVFGTCFLFVLSVIMLAPSCVERIILISIVVTFPLYIIHGHIMHIKVPEKSTLQVYEGKVFFISGKTGRKGLGGTRWQIVDKQGKSHSLFCAMSGSFIMGGCSRIEKKDFERYNGKQAIVYYSEKFGIMEASIGGEEIYNYDEQRKWFTEPLNPIDYPFIFVSVIALMAIIRECFKNFSLLVSFFSNPLRWRRQEILRYEQLLKEKDAQNV